MIGRVLIKKRTNKLLIICTHLVVEIYCLFHQFVHLQFGDHCSLISLSTTPADGLQMGDESTGSEVGGDDADSD